VDWLSSLQARLLPALWSVETAHVSYWLGAQVWLSTSSELVYPVVAFVSTLPMKAKHNHPAYVSARPSLLLALNSTLFPHYSWLAKETIALSPLPWPQNRNTGFVVGRMWSYNEEARVWWSACCKSGLLPLSLPLPQVLGQSFVVDSCGQRAKTTNGKALRSRSD